MAKQASTDVSRDEARVAARRSRGPVVRPTPLRHAVFDALVEMIISQELAPGDHLGEGDLAEQLGVSRQPVREAFQQLQAEGWVDLRPGQGAFVHAPTEKEADDLLHVRTLLESEAARLAAQSHTSADISHLRALCREGKRAVRQNDTATIVSTNAALHAYIMQIGANKVLGELSRLVERRVRWYYTPIAQTRGNASWDEHAAIIDAIDEADVDRAARLMAAHTERTRESKHRLATLASLA